MIKKADIVLFIIIVILGIGISLWSFSYGEKGSQVVITVDGELYGTYDLNKDQTISVKNASHRNKITIKDGTVSMVFANCPNQDCVEHKSISKTNQTITCLPNKVMVTIEGNEEGGYDVISN